MIIKRLIFYIMIFLVLGCRPKPNLITDFSNKEKPGGLVLIFKEPPVNNRYKFSNGLSTSNNGLHEIAYVDDQFLTRKVPLNYDQPYDTLVIESTREFLDIQHTYKAIDKLNYYFKNGDSVLFTYENQKPVASILNRTAGQYDANYEMIKREMICNGEFPGMAKLNSFFGFYDFDFKARNFKEEVVRVTELIRTDAEREFDEEEILLDSFANSGLISDQIRDFYRMKRKYEMRRLRIFEPGFISDYPDTQKSRSKFNDIRKFVLDQEDSFIYYTFFNDFLGAIYNTYFIPRVSRIVTTNSNLPDYKALYDTIKNSAILGDGIRKMLLLANMEHIIHESSATEIQFYLEKFKKDANDTAFVNHLVNKYKLDSQVSHRLNLNTISRQRLTFEEVIAQNKGKLIYVDFWASWCGPCIRALPYSKELHAHYKDKDISFIYLSKDESFIQWEKAAKKYKLTDPLSSFIIDNQFSSKLLDDLNIAVIPRYLLFDRNGKLVHQNAPGPQGVEIRRLIDQYLVGD